MKSQLPNYATCERIFPAPDGAVPIIKRKPASDTGTYLGVHYRVHSAKVKCLRRYPTRTEAIAAFERACKRAGIAPLLGYPPGVSGDSITTDDIAYPRRTCAQGMREGHGWVYVEATNHLKAE